MTTDSKCPSCCLECGAPKPDHYAHCSHCRDTTTASDIEAYDYSHLIGNPGLRHEKVFDEIFDVAQFEGLLTDYDRILLGFGMHISCGIEP